MVGLDASAAHRSGRCAASAACELDIWCLGGERRIGLQDTCLDQAGSIRSPSREKTARDTGAVPTVPP